MTAREWLNRARYIDTEIDQLRETANAERERITKVTPSIGGSTVSGSKDPHKFDEYAALQAEIARMSRELSKTKRQILRTIRKLKDGRYRSLLIGYYVKGQTWERVAEEMNYSRSQIFRLHNAALSSIEPLIPKMELNETIKPL